MNVTRKPHFLQINVIDSSISCKVIDRGKCLQCWMSLSIQQSYICQFYRKKSLTITYYFHTIRLPNLLKSRKRRYWNLHWNLSIRTLYDSTAVNIWITLQTIDPHVVLKAVICNTLLVYSSRFTHLSCHHHHLPITLRGFLILRQSLGQKVYHTSQYTLCAHSRYP